VNRCEIEDAFGWPVGADPANATAPGGALAPRVHMHNYGVIVRFEQWLQFSCFLIDI